MGHERKRYLEEVHKRIGQYMKPIAWYDPTNGMVSTDKDSPLFTPLGQVWPLYLPHTWTGLTLGEQGDLYSEYSENPALLYRAIEAKLRSKNV